MASCWHGPLTRDFLGSKKRWLNISPCCFLGRPPFARTGRLFASVLTKYLGVYGLMKRVKMKTTDNLISKGKTNRICSCKLYRTCVKARNTSTYLYPAVCDRCIFWSQQQVYILTFPLATGKDPVSGKKIWPRSRFCSHYDAVPRSRSCSHYDQCLDLDPVLTSMQCLDLDPVLTMMQCLDLDPVLTMMQCLDLDPVLTMMQCLICRPPRDSPLILMSWQLHWVTLHTTDHHEYTGSTDTVQGKKSCVKVTVPQTIDKMENGNDLQAMKSLLIWNL